MHTNVLGCVDFFEIVLEAAHTPADRMANFAGASRAAEDEARTFIVLKRLKILSPKSSYLVTLSHPLLNHLPLLAPFHTPLSLSPSHLII